MKAIMNLSWAISFFCARNQLLIRITEKPWQFLALLRAGFCLKLFWEPFFLPLINVRLSFKSWMKCFCFCLFQKSVSFCLEHARKKNPPLIDISYPVFARYILGCATHTEIYWLIYKIHVKRMYYIQRGKFRLVEV